eukprot:XP_011675252.1 PREDICTED: SAP30-binding protein [Strongylocentrotus purpuratus]
MSHNDGGMRRLTHLVSYTSDSDEERVREDDEEDVMESIPEEERVGDEDAEIEAMQMSETERSFKESPSPSSNAPSLVSYEREESKGTRTTGLVAYEGEDDDGGRRSKEGGGEEGDYHDESWLEAKLSPGDDLEDRVKVDKGKLVDSSYFNASMSLPESALSQKIRRLSAEEVTLPPEPPGRCSRHLQEKISSYYKKNLNLNQIIQRRKDFRNPSIYEKMINFLGVDELGTNYPKKRHCIAPRTAGKKPIPAKSKQRDGIREEEREKTQKETAPKVEFCESGVVRNRHRCQGTNCTRVPTGVAAYLINRPHQSGPRIGM